MDNQNISNYTSPNQQNPVRPKNDAQTKASNWVKNTGDLSVILGWVSLAATFILVFISYVDYHDSKISKATLVKYIFAVIISLIVSILMIVLGRELKRPSVNVNEAKRNLWVLFFSILVVAVANSALTQQSIGFLVLILWIMIIRALLAIRKALKPSS